MRGLFVSLPPSAGALVLFGGKGIDVGAAVLVALLVAGALVLAGSIWWSWATRRSRLETTGLRGGRGSRGRGDSCTSLISWTIATTDETRDDILTRDDGIQLRLGPHDLAGTVGAVAREWTPIAQAEGREST